MGRSDFKNKYSASRYAHILILLCTRVVPRGFQRLARSFDIFFNNFFFHVQSKKTSKLNFYETKLFFTFLRDFFKLFSYLGIHYIRLGILKENFFFFFFKLSIVKFYSFSYTIERLTIFENNFLIVYGKKK